MKRRIVFAAVVVAMLFLSAVVPACFAQKAKQPASAAVANLPFDPNLTIKKLGNGISYYIMVNRKPEKRAELRLVVNAGSVLEDDDQQGLAHLMEHMEFNGTKNFKKQALVNYIESIGMRFGPEVNAYTSFDETVYMLSIPVDSTDALEKGFQILEDWAHQPSLEPEEIDKERGVVIEEWRIGRGAEARIRDKQYPVLFKGSRYADRLPIGQKSILETFKHERIRKFYSDWYRPDLMAVVAVGDFDRARIERLIEKHFSGIPAAKNPVPRPIYQVPDHEQPLFSVATDPEATISRVSVYYEHPVRLIRTEKDFRRTIIERLCLGMFNSRLAELARGADAPFLGANAGKMRQVRTKEMFTVMASVKDGGIENGLGALLTELARVETFGFTQSELDRQKKDMLRSAERAYSERDKTESAILTRKYISNYLSKEPVPGPENEYLLIKKLLPGVTLAEADQTIRSFTGTKSRVVLASAPQKSGVAVPSEDNLAAVFNSAVGKDITPYVDKVAGRELLEKKPVAGKVAGREEIKDLGITVLQLSNGVRVILKPTDFKNDEILMSAWGFGGSSLAPDSAVISASAASSIVQESGVGDFDLTSLQKLLQGKIVSTFPFVGELSEGFSGSSSPSDFETMLQLVYMYFTAPRSDSTAFRSFKERTRGFLRNRSARPESAFEDTVQVTMAQYNQRRKPMTEQDLDKIDPQASFAFYRDRFAGASGFTFIFVGNLKTNEVLPLLLTYLGGLPSSGRQETWKDSGIRPPAGVVEKQVRKGIEPKSQVRIIFSGPFQWSPEHRHELQSLVDVLRIKLREQLREEKSGTYGASVSGTNVQYPNSEYRITISFGCDPLRVDELVRTAMTQIDSLKNVGPSGTVVNKVREIQVRERDRNLKENRFWLSVLESAYTNNDSPEEINGYSALVERLTPDFIKTAANTYLDSRNYVKVVLYPEQK